MNSSGRQTLLVIGGSGAMGSRVIEHLARTSDPGAWRYRVLTRNPDSRACDELARRHPDQIEFARGSVSDVHSLEQAMEGVHCAFANTSYWTYFQGALNGRHATPTLAAWAYREALASEIRDGALILEAARKAGVRHFLHSSLDAMDRPSEGRFPAPHFDAKAEVESFIEEQRRTSGWYRECVSVLVTAPYTENFLSSRMFRFGGQASAVHLDTRAGEPVLRLRVPIGDAVWPMATLDDIGGFAALMLQSPEQWAGGTLAMTSDQMPMQEVAATFTRVTGIRAVYEPYDLEQYRHLGFPEAPAIANMFGFFRDIGVKRDLPRLLQLRPELCSFEQWLRVTGWRGEIRTVQKDLAA